MKTKIAIIGLGKIATDQHVPAIARSDKFELAAIVDPNTSMDGVDCFKNIDDMIAARPDIKVVSLCVPPQIRFDIAKTALTAKLDVVLEKPPGSTLSEVIALEELAKANKCNLFATWHSRYADGIIIAKEKLKSLDVKNVEIIWKEDVRRWHPGQEWIWQPGGLGVFDTGINALSIITEILPEKMFLTSGILEIPSNLFTPVAAELNFRTTLNKPVTMSLDFLQTGPPTWQMNIETEQGLLKLSGGGAVIAFNDKILVQSEGIASEYDLIYAHFTKLILLGKSEVDVTPLMHVADCFMLCKHIQVEPFIE